MKCDTCSQDSPVVMRVVIAKGYDRSLSRPVFNCPACFEKKEHTKQRSGFEAQGSPAGRLQEPGRAGQPLPPAQRPEPQAKPSGGAVQR